MTTNIEMRTIEPKDNAALKNLIQTTLKEYRLNIPGTAYYDPYIGKLSEYYGQTHRADYWVLTQDDRVIGGVGIAPFNGHKNVAELQKYYIEKAFQGCGYGSKLFQQAKQFAIDNGFKQLYLETTDVLAKANKVYEYYGFEKLKEPLAGSEHDAMNTWYIYDLMEK